MVDLLKTFLSKEMKIKIDDYLFKRKSTKFLSELNLDLNSNYISLKSYSINYLEHLKSIWLELANLSVNLYVEYEFFRQFSFPNRYKSQIYEESLKKLGYKRHKGIWKIDQIPNEQFIIENIFYSYFYMFLCQEKKIELDNEKCNNENAKNTLKLEKLCNPSRNNNTNEEITFENIDHVVLPIIGEMGNIDNGIYEKCDSEVLEPSRDEESISNTPINAYINATCSNLSSTLQKSEMIIENKMRSNTSSNSKIKSNPSSSHWICNVCSYNQNNSSNIICEVCLSSKFAKINSRAFQSSSEASNENRIEHDARPKDKWTCTQCTFNNKLTVDLCEICLVPNINKIGTMNDKELPEETWCCKRCGENNLFECYKCKNCRVPAEFFNKWRCGQCSYYNDKIAKHCGACEIENPYLMKCNICAKNLVNMKYDKICKECRNLVERSTNRETIDYQDNGKMQSEISEIVNVLDNRNQRRNKKNANQNNSKNNVSQNVGKRSQDSIVDRNINNEETGNSKIDNLVNKTPSETTKFYKSIHARDENSGNPDKSNKDNQRKTGHKKTIPPGIKEINKKISKPCKNCKSKVCVNNQYWCTKCENYQWYCENEACAGINFQNEYCKQCTAKIGSNFSNCANFWVIKDCKEVQCGFCLKFNAGTSNKCSKCNDLRYVYLVT